MKTISLNGSWSLWGRDQEFPENTVPKIEAKVPGDVHLDLSRSGFLPSDLFMGTNILETQKFETYEWWYERTFDAPEQRNQLFLVFEGVDCVAEYFINGEKIGESDNMFISHEFKIGELLNDGENTLTVHIKSPVLGLDQIRIRLRRILSLFMMNQFHDSLLVKHFSFYYTAIFALCQGLWGN